MAEITVENLVKKYGKDRGVFDISLQVEKGEVFGFLGPNGAGKTTTIRQLMGFSRPDSGLVKIRGMESYKKYSEILKFVGYLPGELALPDGLNGWEFIKMMQGLRKEKCENRIDYLLNKFDLEPDMNVKKMSLGMKRKLTVVTAFMTDPDILILDEPTSGLDPIMQKRFISFIKEEKDRGKTIFMSSHIFSEIDAVSDRIAIIKDGRIVSTFNAKDLKHNKNKTYQIKFCANSDFEKFCALPFDIIFKNSEKNEIKVCINDEDINILIQKLEKMQVYDFSEIKFSLSDYFMNFYIQSKDFGELNNE